MIRRWCEVINEVAGGGLCADTGNTLNRRITLVTYWMLLFVFLALQPSVVVFSQLGCGLLASSFSRFPDLTQRRATVGRTPPDEWSIRRRDLYQTTHNTHNRQTSMPWVGFEPTISAGGRPLGPAVLECALCKVRHTAVHTAELVVTGRSDFGAETAMENLKNYKRQINFQQKWSK